MVNLTGKGTRVPLTSPHWSRILAMGFSLFYIPDDVYFLIKSFFLVVDKFIYIQTKQNINNKIVRPVQMYRSDKSL